MPVLGAQKVLSVPVVSLVRVQCRWPLSERNYFHGFQEIPRLKLRISTRATQPLYDLGMNFGVRYSYDAAQCTGPSFFGVSTCRAVTVSRVAELWVHRSIAGPWSCDLNYEKFGLLGQMSIHTFAYIYIYIYIYIFFFFKLRPLNTTLQLLWRHMTYLKALQMMVVDEGLRV